MQHQGARYGAARPRHFSVRSFHQRAAGLIEGLDVDVVGNAIGRVGEATGSVDGQTEGRGAGGKWTVGDGAQRTRAADRESGDLVGTRAGAVTRGDIDETESRVAGDVVGA